MGRVGIKPEKLIVVYKGEKVEKDIYRRKNLKKFNPEVLGIGDIGADADEIDAIAAVFDLEGFTKFCAQVDPHLSVPKFLTKFLSWLFDGIIDVMVMKNLREGKILATDLPFFAKFLGDGVLFLWESRGMNDVKLCNVVVSLSNVCRKYTREFAPMIKKELTGTPKKLRCSVARGKVLSVGKGEDYVGPCINIAARLQKESRVPFCFHRTGFEYEKGMHEETASRYIVKSITIRGIGEERLMCVRKTDFERLGKRDQAIFRDV